MLFLIAAFTALGDGNPPTLGPAPEPVELLSDSEAALLDAEATADADTGRERRNGRRRNRGPSRPALGPLTFDPVGTVSYPGCLWPGPMTSRGDACSNGIDNDGNGLIDCADPGCKCKGR